MTRLSVLRIQARWWLDEADRLDRLAANPPEHPTPTNHPTNAWVEATLGPTVLRQQAQNHRAHAARLARKANR